MKRYLVLAFAALVLAGGLSACASYDSMSHSKCQALKSNNHNYGR